MIAIPVKTDRNDAPVAPLFGKAKWFAFIDAAGAVEVAQNRLQSGRDVVGWLQEKGVKRLIFAHMGGNPFMLLQKAGILCYHAGKERITLSRAVEKLQSGELERVDGSNMAAYVEQSSMHSHAKRGEHHHGAHKH